MHTAYGEFVLLTDPILTRFHRRNGQRVWTALVPHHWKQLQALLWLFELV
jgi:hypothetical protein